MPAKKKAPWGSIPSRTREYVNAYHKSKRERAAGRSRPETCEVCYGPPTRAIAWDHNHGTGKFRGWLCNKCNSALGLVGDNPVILEALASYLRTKGCSPTRPLIR